MVPAENEDALRRIGWTTIVCRVEDLMVAVSADPFRANAYGSADNGILGFPTTKAIRLPADWARLLREARAR